MDELGRKRLVLDIAGRDLVSVPNGAKDRDWIWATADGALIAKAGTLTDQGGGGYRFTGTSLETLDHTGREGTEADLLAGIGSDLGWRMPVQPVIPGDEPLAR